MNQGTNGLSPNLKPVLNLSCASICPNQGSKESAASSNKGQIRRPNSPETRY